MNGSFCSFTFYEKEHYANVYETSGEHLSIMVSCYFSLICSQPSYWCSSPRVALLKEKEDEEEAEKVSKGEFIEEEPAGLVSGVKIKHLAKVPDAWCFALKTLDS